MPDKKLDGPDEVAFTKEIIKHIPGSKVNMGRTVQTAAILGAIASVTSRKPK